ncbi:inositol monophosphatase family protein [Arcobacter sp. LA11]|uniref:inositol monophosphatase family protein n=1 Tax=Arcobacter sp. LA11 TaxID=1898176 RepID=UPI0009330442|nr:inositol monophosphatase family protein [Arcobacter sp. LA11]
MFDYNSFTNAVIKANKELYEYINTHMDSSDLEESSTIGYGGDNTLNIDLIAENIFIKYLDSFGDIFSEEAGLISSKSNIKIIIDPLDGSHNFLSGLPYYGTSVALQIDNETKAGYVVNLVNHIMIYKVNDNLEQIDILNNKSINFIKVENPQIGIFERAYSYPNVIKKLNQEKIKFRSPGAIAISLAYAKNYNFVLFAGSIREFDIAAALYICSDLFIHKEAEFLIMAKKQYYFTLIKEIIKE